MKTHAYYLLVAQIILCLATATAQDVHFSQFYATPLQVNPAQTGFFNGNVRFDGIYRNQWASVTTPYSTFSGSGDLSITDKRRDDIIGIGMIATTDKAGDANFTTSECGLTFAFNKKLNEVHPQYLGVGGSIAYSNTHFDYSNLHFDNEYFGLADNEKLTTSTGFLDLSAGAEYNILFTEESNFNFGAAVYHFNQPKYSFTGSTAPGEVLNLKYVLNTGTSFKLNDMFSLYPRVLYTQQGTQKELNFGSFIRINLDKSSHTPKYGVYLGTWYRVDDAVIFVTRFDIDNLSIAFSYDVNTSTLYQASYGMGGPEISFTYTAKIKGLGRKTVYCPQF